jgi:hypothetical protein
MFTKIMLTSETAFTNRQREKHIRPDVSSVIALIEKIAKPASTETRWSRTGGSHNRHNTIEVLRSVD